VAHTPMTWWNPSHFSQKIPHLAMRRRLMQAVRGFFDSATFWEVETPALQACPTFDTHIHAFQTDLLGCDLQKERGLYLHTSPEFAMKKLMVAGVPKLYQICHAFRNGEGSRLHSPEFTLLEWYRADTDYTSMMADCEVLLRHCAEKLEIKTYRFGGDEANPFKPWQKISVCAAFERYADMTLTDVLDDTDGFAGLLRAHGIRCAEGDGWDDLFFRVMAEKIEPHLGRDVPCILYDYPVSMAALSRRNPSDPRFAERFELYVCGVELVNAFSELNDPQEQRTRFETDMVEKERLYGTRYPMDEDFMKALAYGMPECSGAALGLDRLAMLCSGAERIEQVLWAGKP